MGHAYNSGSTGGSGGPNNIFGSILMLPFLLIAGVIILWRLAREDRKIRSK